MKKFNFKNHIQNYDFEIDDLTFPITDDFGDDLRFTHEDGGKLKSYVTKDKMGYREVYLDITSFLGSIGAVHYYGKLCDRSINFTYVEDVNNKSSISGYGTRGVPSKYTDLDFQLIRPVTDRDVKHDEDNGREDYMRVSKYETTRGFWQEDHVIELGKKVFNAAFKGKWKLRIDSYSGNKDETIYLK